MLIAVVRTEMWFFGFILFLSFVIGASLVAAIFLIRRRPAAIPIAGANETLYLAVSRLSHRLKTVGEVIRGHMHGFSDQLPEDEDRWRVARRAISDEATEVGNLTQRLDLMVRLGMSGQPLVMEPVNVPALLEDLMIDLAPAAEAKGITLGGVVRSESGPFPHISGDASALREVFSNILENGVKHNPSGTEITGEVRFDSQQLTVTIADTGAGNGDNLVRITNNTATANQDGSPNWSPDGSMITWVHRTNGYPVGGYDVWAMNADGSGQTNLTNDFGTVAEPDWSP